MELKEVVKEKYGQAALRVNTGGSSCCGAGAARDGCCDPITSNLYDASQTCVLPEEAVLASLGCGNPTALARLNPGETVLTPFAGIGSELWMSVRLGRKAIGAELKPSYYRQAIANMEMVDRPEDGDLKFGMGNGDGEEDEDDDEPNETPGLAFGDTEPDQPTELPVESVVPVVPDVPRKRSGRKAKPHPETAFEVRPDASGFARSRQITPRNCCCVGSSESRLLLLPPSVGGKRA